MTARSSIPVVCTLFLLACSGGGGVVDAGLPFSSFCSSYGDTFGNHLATCQGGPKDLWVKTLDQGFRCSELQRALDAGRVAYDPAFAQPCLTAVASLSCASLFSSPSVPDCSKSLAGKIAVGSTCYGNIDCGEGNFCSGFPATTCAGTCKAQLAAGVACASGDECVRGYYCNNGICTLNPPAGSADVGASCTGGVQCKPGLVCDEVTKNCAKPIKEGQPCSFGHRICEPFTSCSASSSSCVRYGSAGGSCGATIADGGVAYEYAGCLDSYCKLPSGASAGTCAVLIADQGVCTVDGECASGTCTASKCAPRCVVP